MIHNRDADAEVLDVLRAEGAPDTVIFHASHRRGWRAPASTPAGCSAWPAPSASATPALREGAGVIPPGQLLVETDTVPDTPVPRRTSRTALPVRRGRARRAGRDVAQKTSQAATAAYRLDWSCRT